MVGIADENEHAALVKIERLRWLANTMTTLLEREDDEPGSVPELAVEALHSTVHSWVTRLLDLDVPA